jgi:hypothetical protein
MCTYGGPEIHDSDLLHPFVHKREAATSTADKKAQEMFVEMYKVALKADPSTARELRDKWEKEFGRLEGTRMGCCGFY